MSGRTLYCLGEAWLELESPAPLSSAEAFRPRVGGTAAALALAVCAGLLFAMFYPALSGLPVPEGYARLLLWFPKWQFYSL